MATVIGIFEDHYIKNKPLPVVRPGTQSRRFTHINDTIKVCYKAWKNNKCRFYSISNKESYTIREVAKLFKSKIKFIPSRKGERYASALSNLSLSNKIYRNYGKIKLKDYIKNFLKYNEKQLFYLVFKLKVSLQCILFMYKPFAGNYCERVIPDPIPNSEVKPFCADGTLS